MKEFVDEDGNTANLDGREIQLYFADVFIALDELVHDPATISIKTAKELRDWLTKAVKEAEKK